MSLVSLDFRKGKEKKNISLLCICTVSTIASNVMGGMIDASFAVIGSHSVLRVQLKATYRKRKKRHIEQKISTI